MSSEILAAAPALGNIFFLGIERADIAVSFGADCGGCGGFNYFQKIAVYGSNLIYCLNCGQPNIMPPLLEIGPRPETVRANLDFLLQKYDRLAFWGLGRMFRALIDPALVDRPGIHLLDAAAAGRFGHKEVERPTAILEQGLRLVITVPEFAPAHQGIRLEAEKLGVARVLDFYDLMSPAPPEWGHYPDDRPAALFGAR